MIRAHNCPGGCGAQVTYERLSCPACWARLPKPLKDDIGAAYRRRRVEPLRHIRAVSAAVGWYRGERA